MIVDVSVENSSSFCKLVCRMYVHNDQDSSSFLVYFLRVDSTDFYYLSYVRESGSILQFKYGPTFNHLSTNSILGNASYQPVLLLDTIAVAIVSYYVHNKFRVSVSSS